MIGKVVEFCCWRPVGTLYCKTFHSLALCNCMHIAGRCCWWFRKYRQSFDRQEACITNATYLWLSVNFKPVSVSSLNVALSYINCLAVFRVYFWACYSQVTSMFVLQIQFCVCCLLNWVNCLRFSLMYHWWGF